MNNRAILILVTLPLAADAAADTLQFVCVGTESIYTATFAEHQENLTKRPATVQMEVDLEKKTMSVSGTDECRWHEFVEATPPSDCTSTVPQTRPLFAWSTC
jgi:hypothetical protein